MGEVVNSESNISKIKDDNCAEKQTEIGEESSNPRVELENGSKDADPKESTEQSTSEPSIKFSSEHDYELIDNVYYYTNKEGKRLKYDTCKSEWIEVKDDEYGKKNENSDVTTDEEGRQFYYADGVYLCRDCEGMVYYMNDKNEWELWDTQNTESSEALKSSEDGRWFYYYKGKQRFSRDNFNNKVYRYCEEKNDWEEWKTKKRKKQTNQDEEEEFDTDEEELSEDEGISDSSTPPGWPNDPSITYDGVQYTKKDLTDNTMYEWDTNRRAWFPQIDDDFMANYQLSYGFNPDGTKDLNPLKFDDDEDDEAELQKEKEEKEKKEAIAKRKPGWFEPEDVHNPKVYVSNLPEKMTEEEFLEFMQKCGVLFKDPVNQKFKIKMYKDKEGNFKGDALCTYIKNESVDLALQILDGARIGSHTVKVERAKFELKGDYDPSLKPKKRRKKELDKIAKNQDKLLAWLPDPVRGQRAKHENTVILKNVFDPSEFEESPEKILTHKEAIRLQAITFGQIKKIELFDRHPDGVIRVTFAEVESADMCGATLNKRLYLKRSLDVQTWDGKQNYKVEETEEQKAERLKKWEKFLEEK